jgi:aminoglycoside phosphotransferase
MTVSPRMLLAEDPSVPQRDRMLDADLVGLRLPALLGVEGAERCEVARVKYKVGESLRVLFRVRIGNVEHFVSARTFRRTRAREVFDRESARVAAVGTLRAVAYDEDLSAVFWTFPHDRRIERLAALASLTSVPTTEGEQACAESRVVAYSPEKCAIARCVDAAGETLAYAKVYAGDEGREVRRVYDSLTRAVPENPLPRVTGYSDRTLFLEPIVGRRIADLEGEELVRGFQGFGAALATLHSLPAPTIAPSERLSPGSLQTAARVVGRARPDVASLAARLADDLERRRMPSNERPVCLHGDVHPKNALLRDEGVALVDLDQAGTGLAASDVGSLLAGLRYGRLVGSFSTSVERTLGRVFLDGYATVRPLPDSSSIRWHTSAALLVERSMRAVTRVRVPGLAHLPGIFVSAVETLGSGGAR